MSSGDRVKTKKKTAAPVKEEVQDGYQPRLKTRYRGEIVPALMKEFGYTNVMQVPRLRKIVLNIGLGEATRDAKALEHATRDLEAITGQHPVATKAKKSVANFKIREGMVIGLMVTLTGARMYEFLDRLLNTALPRIRDFRGVSTKAFDGRGNYSLGLQDQTLFAEMDYDAMDKLRGLQVSVVTSAKTDDEARRLLALFGMPFARQTQ